MDENIYKRALNSERDNPHKSLKFYSTLQKENQIFHWDILLAFLAGSICAFYLVRWVGSYRNIYAKGITLVLWIVIGLYPGFLMYEWRKRKARFICLNRFLDVIYLTVAPLTIYFGTVVHIFGILLVAALSSSVLYIIIGLIYSFFSGIPFSSNSLFTLPHYLKIPIVSISIFYGFLLVLSDPVPPSEPLALYLLKFKRMFIALHFRLKSISFFVIAVGVVQAIYRLKLNELFGEPKIGLALGFLGGLFFSLVYGFIERDVVKSYLLRLAMVRCELQQNRIEEADVRLMLLEEQYLEINTEFFEIRSSYPKIIMQLIEVLEEFVGYKKYKVQPDCDRLESKLQFVKANVEVSDPNYKYYIDAINKTLEMLNP
jgi:hypothetical protein